MTTDSNQSRHALGTKHLYLGRLPASCDPETFSWHSHAGLANSSQVACINAFGHTADLDGGVSDKVFSEFFGSAFPEMRVRSRPRRWTVELEYEEQSLLNEFGTGQSTSIDAFCTTSVDVVAVEAKFDRDAKDGFGCCSQPKKNACAGYHGPGSDLLTKTNTDCRLDAWHRERSPRLYWTLGRQYFQPSALAPQSPKMICPLSGPNYQLMRNFLFAASFAEKERKVNFGVAVVCPAKRIETLAKQLEEFRCKILLPKYRHHVQLLTYDDLVKVMRSTLRDDQIALAEHVSDQLRQLG